MTPRTVAWLAALLLAPVLSLQPQADQSAERPAQFRSTLDLVRLDVSVLDRDRRPITGLTAADFVVEEDGKPQPVLTFLGVEPRTASTAAPWIREIVEDVRRNDNLAEKQLVVLILNDALPSHKGWLIKTAEAVVQKLGPDDLMAVVHVMSTRGSQEFTLDRTALRTSIASFTPQSGLEGDRWYRQRVTISVLRGVVDALAMIPDRRKAIIYLGGGHELMMLGIPQKDAGALENDPTFIRLYLDLFRRAQVGNVNIHAIEPSAESVTPSEFSLMLAHNTGGIAPAPRDSFGEIDKILAVNSSYYLVGYQNPNPAQDGRFRRVTVKVNRPGAVAYTRAGYYASRLPDVASLQEPQHPSDQSGILPKSELPMQMATSVLRLPRTNLAVVPVVLGLRQSVDSSLIRRNESVEGRLDIFPMNGGPHVTERFGARIVAATGATKDIGYEVLAKVQLSPGRYHVRASARTESDGRSGSVYADIDIAPMPRDGFVMSPILVQTRPAIAAAPRTLFERLIPVIPTSLREFTTTMNVVAVTQVAFGDRPSVGAVKVRSSIRDSRGLEIHTTEANLTPPPFELDRAVFHLVQIPTATLTPGEYLLSLSAGMATKKTLTERHVRFRVQ